MDVIEYFYSAHSSFAYIGSRLFMDIAAAGARRIEHRPMDLRKIIDAVGSQNSRTPAHRAYFSFHENARWAEARDVEILEWPTHHANDITLPNCMLIAGLELGIDIGELAHRMLEAHWREDADLADADTLVRLAADVGLVGPPLLDAARTPQVQAAYEANTAEAIERSVFGSPTYFLDGDMFYGQDHLELVARALKKPFKAKWPRPLAE